MISAVSAFMAHIAMVVGLCSFSQVLRVKAGPSVASVHEDLVFCKAATRKEKGKSVRSPAIPFKVKVSIAIRSLVVGPQQTFVGIAVGLKHLLQDEELTGTAAPDRLKFHAFGSPLTGCVDGLPLPEGGPSLFYDKVP